MFVFYQQQNLGRRFDASKMHLSSPPGDLGCCPFKVFCSVVIGSLLHVPPIICGGSVFGLCFGMHYFVSFLDLQSS